MYRPPKKDISGSNIGQPAHHHTDGTDIQGPTQHGTSGMDINGEWREGNGLTYLDILHCTVPISGEPVRGDGSCAPYFLGRGLGPKQLKRR